jgi:hypothetical protein
VDPIIENQRRQPVLEGCGPGQQIAAQAVAEPGDPARLDLAAR